MVKLWIKFNSQFILVSLHGKSSLSYQMVRLSVGLVGLVVGLPWSQLQTLCSAKSSIRGEKNKTVPEMRKLSKSECSF